MSREEDGMAGSRPLTAGDKLRGRQKNNGDRTAEVIEVLPTGALLKHDTGRRREIEWPTLVQKYGHDDGAFISAPYQAQEQQTGTQSQDGGPVRVSLDLSPTELRMLDEVIAFANETFADHGVEATQATVIRSLLRKEYNRTVALKSSAKSRQVPMVINGERV